MDEHNGYNGYPTDNGYEPTDNYNPEGDYVSEESYYANVGYVPQDVYSDSNAYSADYGYDNNTHSPELTDSISEPFLSPENISQIDEPTPEEIEQERRRRAAIRRRKQAAREARRRKRMQQAIFRCSILLIAVILVIVGIIKGISGIVKHAKDKKEDKKVETTLPEEEETTEEPPVVAKIDEAIVAKELPATREEAITMLQEQLADTPEIQSILDNAAVFSDDLLRYVAVNNELIQYVIDYPAKINPVYDGEFTMEVDTSEVPLFLTYDDQWGYADYGKDVIALRGSGPVCLSMAYTYLKQSGTMNPIKVADFATAQGYLDENGNTAWTLMGAGALALGLQSDQEVIPNEDDIITALDNGSVIICAMTAGDFTKEETFILIKEYKDGLFYVNDPTSTARSEVGWDFARLEKQMDSLWIISGTPDPVSDDTPEDAEGTTDDATTSETEGGDTSTATDTTDTDTDTAQ